MFKLLWKNVNVNEEMENAKKEAAKANKCIEKESFFKNSIAQDDH